METHVEGSIFAVIWCLVLIGRLTYKRLIFLRWRRRVGGEKSVCERRTNLQELRPYE